jgi:phosphoglycolate phosphatase
MLILFDIDMTLLKSDHIGIDCLRDAGRDLFNTDFTIETITFGGGIDPVIIADMLILNKVEPTTTNINAMRSHYASALREIAEHRSIANALPGAHELVEATRNHDELSAMGLLTGNYPETGEIKLRAAGFDMNHFKVNAWGDSSPHENPVRAHLPPAAIQTFHELQGQPIIPESVVVIGDTIHDVSCALDSGCRSLAVATGHNSRNELEEAGAHKVVDDLTNTGEILDWMMNTQPNTQPNTPSNRS